MVKHPTSDLLLEASAVLALLRREDGYELVRAALQARNCFISSVTLTELEGKLIGRGEYTPNQVREALQMLAPILREVSFDARCREKSTFYYARKNPYNLSLGDAACLGTAEALGLDVLTAEQNWARLPDLPMRIELIR